MNDRKRELIEHCMMYFTFLWLYVLCLSLFFSKQNQLQKVLEFQNPYLLPSLDAIKVT